MSRLECFHDYTGETVIAFYPVVCCLEIILNTRMVFCRRCGYFSTGSHFETAAGSITSKISRTPLKSTIMWLVTVNRWCKTSNFFWNKLLLGKCGIRKTMSKIYVHRLCLVSCEYRICHSLKPKTQKNRLLVFDKMTTQGLLSLQSNYWHLAPSKLCPDEANQRVVKVLWKNIISHVIFMV